MRRVPHLLGAACCAIALLALPAAAGADPSDDPNDQHAHESHSGPPELAPFAGPAFSNMTLVGNSDKDGTTNSDLAFWGHLAFAGNYDGFRILDISDPASPTVLVDYFCRGPQNDVSVYRLRGRLYLFQSVDTPQTSAHCDGTRAGSSADTPLVNGQRQFGFEGIRVFDVTNPAAPMFVTGVPTACGSHTHTLVPDQRHQRVLLYVSSYPLGSNVTPSSYTGHGPRCESPHKKISIVEVTARHPARARVLREEPLSSDSRTYPGAVAGNPLAPPFIACHDVQVFLQDRIAVGSCAGDGQIWDISNPANPTASDGERHTHIPTTGFTGDDWEFVHNAVVTWDGKFFALADETGGGGTNECDGPAEERGGQSENGFYYFYPMVKPGEPTPPLLSRYMIPRPQGAEICVSHNGNVLPTDHGYFLVSAYYQGGNTLVDFTDPANPTEIAYSDPADETGLADSWSTYWYNGFAYANGGLNRRGPTGNRGLDVFTLQRPDGTAFHTRRFPYMNPQTQERFQSSGSSNGH
jgi:hypothetical protein